MRFPPRRALLCLLLILAALATLGARHAQAAGTRTVLVLYSLGSDSASEWQRLVRKGMDDELASKRWGDAPDIFEEHFDSVRVGEQASLDSMAPYLRTKYASVKLDAIVTENHLAAGFLNSHPDLFPGVPRYYVNHGRRNWRPGDGEALELAPDYGRMLGVIPLVAPSVKRIVVVGDQTPRVQEWIAGVRAASRPYSKQIAFDYWDQQGFSELVRRAAMLGEDTAILMFATHRGQEGGAGTPPDVARKLAAASPVPVFTHVESLVLPGVVGGYVLSGEAIGRVIARILQGQPADLSGVQRYIFDHPTAERHQLRNLPQEALLRNRPVSVWELYRWQILLGATLILLEAALITVLVRVLRSRRNALAALNDERNNLEDRVLHRTLELLTVNSKLEQLATTDPLTGIANRRRMTEQISKELDRARRYKHPLALLMVDIDHFKRINDTYGHDVGDQAIVAVAGALSAAMRSIDLVARFGGEEFVLLMPEASLETAGGAAERLRETVAQLRIDLDGGLTVSLTISVGVAASYPQEAPDSPSALLVRADKALYQAKKEGRDRVVLSAA
ncbi:diguanylate cyclase [Massilia sp. Root351]|uniref:GGDEF domain-containing protein n=1 Tax=Massilia sp. Root351 TaxID=1736522 RepID=UPI000710B6A8|nr:GGDEF domain-containing protein [Massilia sp. Root351]KQV85018.1 diguanylate cyclase [Massilia sp. Root351]